MGDPVNRRILVIDDNRSIHEDFRKILAERNSADAIDAAAAAIFQLGPVPTDTAVAPAFDLHFASQGQEGHAKVVESVKNEQRFALAFVDMRMPPGWDGIQTIEKLWEADPHLQIVICSAYSDYSWTDILAKFGVNDRLLILKKPFDTAEVCQLACALTEKWHLAKYAHLKLNQLKSMVEEQTTALQAEVSERRRSEHALRVSEDRYALAAAAANDGLWDWDLVAGTIFYSSRWKSMFGCTADEISNSPEEWFKRIEPRDLGRVKSEIQAHIDGKAKSLHCEYQIIHRDGKPHWMLCRGLGVVNAAGKMVRFAGSQTDITDRIMAEEQLRHDATHDVLTGLANRAILTDRLGHCIARQKRFGDLFAVLFLDLDRFKVINDSLGHSAGDEFLVQIAARLAASVREMDTVACIDRRQLVRLGGDEFVVLIESISDAFCAVRVAERIMALFTRPFTVGGREVFSSCSIGIALGNLSYEDPDAILRDADTALYRAKGEGIGKYKVFDGNMHASAVSRLNLENDLRRAIERQELSIYYQPIFSLADGKICELEALVRWRHPDRGMILPDEFIPAAEETGIIIPLGAWVMRQACNDLRGWETVLPSVASLALAVNVACKQLVDPGFIAGIEAVLRETGVRADRIHLEITESSAMESSAVTASILRRLNELKIQLHLDDFGTGYSSLSHLHRMPVDALKIDRSFVSTMVSDPSSHSIVKAIVALAHTLKLRVIAEGAETQEQVDMLRATGCDFAQGYFFARPLQEDKVVGFLACHLAGQLAIGA
jgi:diguanylate cyclase (GGDEF)-like protein/PAS domain S-box-containing protein